ncbi:MAG: circularly permuted type 2 ATP-grasp protein [Candidatus Hydrogenedentes bacterium]|nr:circularly permuted type 2 ATP-grasp protein [Candidatus Hydrogenedentota bacterium]
MATQKADIAGESLARGYRAKPGAFDEMSDADGALRPHWQAYAEHIDRIGAVEFQRRHQQAMDLIEEDGVSYNVYGDARVSHRPWTIDLVPEVISEREWKEIDRGIAQRAALLNAVLRDLYGPQTLVRDGIVPAEFVYANPAFLLPCLGLRVPRDRWLHFYAADIARGADGAWMVVADRTQAPSGAGYALENRLVTTRIFPTITQECGVQRLAAFFERLRTTLRELALSNRDNPTIVLMSPGPTHETYFEHSYLARYLNFTLVENDDLTVRDNCVYLKTLEGLSRVDVIFRRVDDQLCDPLDFGTESASGLVGLVQAAYAGNVAIGNALGCGVLEAPALRALLPDLCRHLLKQELSMPSVTTWWCANPEHMKAALERFDSLLVAPAFSGRGWNPTVVQSLNPRERDNLIDAIRARPFDYVAQERIVPSTVPMWTPQGLAPRHAMLRTYAVAGEQDAYAVMPGGLTRFSDSPDSLVISMQRGGGSKDTWALTSGPVDTHTLLPNAGKRIDIKRTMSNLPSRAADNLFWLGRYLERIESTSRIIRCVLSRLTDEASSSSGRELPAIVRSLALVLPCAPGKNGYEDEADLRGVERRVIAALFDRSWNNSVSTTFAVLNNVAWVVRDRLSLDTWRILGRLMEDLPDGGARPPRAGEALALLNQIITDLAAFSGFATENMTRGHGWRFLDIGRRVERTLNTFELLRSCLVIPIEPESAVLQAALEISDSAMTFRSRYGGNLQTPAVLDLLITDESNPRAVAFQSARLVRHIEALPREKSYPFASREQQLVTRLSADLQLADIFELAAVASQSRRAALEVRLFEWAQTLRDVSDALAWHYFSHTQFSRADTTIRRGARA